MDSNMATGDHRDADAVPPPGRVRAACMVSIVRSTLAVVVTGAALTFGPTSGVVGAAEPQAVSPLVQSGTESPTDTSGDGGDTGESDDGDTATTTVDDGADSEPLSTLNWLVTAALIVIAAALLVIAVRRRPTRSSGPPPSQLATALGTCTWYADTVGPELRDPATSDPESVFSASVGQVSRAESVLFSKAQESQNPVWHQLVKQLNATSQAYRALVNARSQASGTSDAVNAAVDEASQAQHSLSWLIGQAETEDV